MQLSAKIVDKKEWAPFEAVAHLDAFGNDKLDEAKDYNFAVVVETDKKEKFMYAVVKELDAETAYLNFGGTFSKFRNTQKGYVGFSEMIDCLTPKYKRIGFVCRATNTAMIKLGLNQGFEIIGMRLVYGYPSLEFLLERGN